MRGQIIGDTTKTLIHRAFNDFGSECATNFIDDLQNVVTEYMKTSSYSVGISDLIADKKTMMAIINTITEKKLEAKKLMDNVHLGIFKNETATSNAMEFETQLNNIMKDADKDTSKIARKSLDKNNRFSMIVNSGSKGNLINITQMLSCLGQQNVEGKRIQYGLDNRTLPHYFKFDDSPGARGFVENSYISGLTASELFFHAMGGRIGLIDTAVKTSQTGYIQRRLIKGLEDLKVEYDMTVRNSNGKVVQFAYGDDGFDSTKVESQNIALPNMTIEDIYMHYDIAGISNTEKGATNIYTKATVTRMKSQLEDTRNMCQKRITNMIEYREMLVKTVFRYKNDNSVKIPVAFQHTIQNIQGNMGLGANSLVDITPLEAFQMIDNYWEKLMAIQFSPPTYLFQAMYYYFLNPRDLLCVKRFHKQALALLLETILLKYKQAIVHPGEMVGVIAGQSIGEPTTQLTLNSFTYETEILVRDSNGIIRCVQIGEFTRQGIEKCKKIDYMADKDTTYAELSDFYEVPSATDDGHTVWRRIEAVTKHPVINEDGSNTMIKVTTRGQREIIATKAKSFVQLINGKIQAINGSELKVGDYLPVSKKPIDYTERHMLNLREVLSPPFDCMHENIPMDYYFGYLLGAYCADGCILNSVVSITNNDNEYLKPIQEWCARYDLTSNLYFQENKTQYVYIHNDVLCRMLEKICGKLSPDNSISDLVVFSNRDCILGFLDAYIGSDVAEITNDDKLSCITMTSVSHKMLTQVQTILKNLGILSNMHKGNQDEITNCNATNTTLAYSLIVTNGQVKKLAQILNMRITEKHERCQELINMNFTYDYCRFDTQIPNIIDGETIMQTRDDTCCVDLEFDQIISIEEVPNTTDYAYDLTVEDTRNFDCANGLCLNDTFHLAGNASKSNVTRGVPRIEEILNLTKSPKRSSLTIHLKPEDESDITRAIKYSKMLEHTKLSDVVKSVQICFDPSDENTRIVDDKVFMEQFREFERMLQECADDTLKPPNTSKWVLRMEMDAETMLDKNITMDDIHFAIKSSVHGNDVQCMYSDFNSEKLVFRIRGNILSKARAKGIVQSLDVNDEIGSLRAYQDMLLNSIVLRGVSNIVNVLPRKLQNMIEKKDGKYSSKDLWVLDTTGTNLLDVLALDYIDITRSYSNDIKEVFDTLGIEAARQTIFDELTDVMETSGVGINYHHLSLLCDRMTLTKGMVSMYRTGILSDDIGPIAKSTFEVHTKVLLDAARHGEFDHMKGVSANVLCGQQGYYGTNAFQVILDMKAMSKFEGETVKTTDRNADIEKMFGGINISANSECSKETVEIRNNIEHMPKVQTGVCKDNYDMGF